MEQNSKNSKKSVYGLCVIAFITIFNPNINLVDFLPDFVGFFILAAVFEKASLYAPYFEEARGALLKLGALSVLKIPALLIILSARSQNTNDNDIVALMSICFAVAELILLISAANHAFNALFYLGQRSDAKALISPVKGMRNPEQLRTLTIVFSVAKCAIYALPELLKLTRVVDSTTVVTGSREYPYVMIAAQLLGFILGAVWLTFMCKYLKSIKNEGKFSEALATLRREYPEEKLDALKENRSLFRTYSVFVISAFLTLELSFDNFSDVNLLPHFLFGIFFSVALIRFSGKSHATKALKKPVLICSSLFIAASVIFYIFQTSFLTEFGYSTLYEGKLADATASYIRTVIAGGVEFILYVSLFVLFFLAAKKYILNSLALSPDSENYSRQDEDYHRSLIRRTLIFTSLGILAGLAKLINITLYINPQMIATDSSELGMPTVLAPAIPWFGVVVTGAAVAFILYSIYYFGMLKDEVSEK